MLIRLADICDIEKGQQIDTDKLEPSKPYKYINGGIKESGYFDEYNTIGNTITVSEGGASCGYVNYVCEPFWCGCHCYRLTNHKVDSRYLYYALKANEQKIMDLRTGVAMPNIRKSSFENLVIKICESESEQQKVVLTLDKITSLIKKSEHELLLLDSIIKSRFNEMFGKDIETVKIGDVLKTTSGGTPSKGRIEYYSNGNIPWLCSGEVNAGIITEVKNKITELGLKNSSAKWIPENSVVVAMYGATAGKVGLLKIKTTTNQAVCSILPDSKFIPEFLYYAVGSKTEELVSKAWGGAQPNISQGIIKNTYIPFPSLDKQNEFASFVSQIDKLKFNVQKRIEKYKELLNKKMDEYFN